MEKGKELRYNHIWLKKKYGEQATNACSPLAFSILFDTEFFVEIFLDKIKSSIGISINQENIMLADYCSKINRSTFQQYNVFETNGKFSIPKDILLDLWGDSPDTLEECYVYFISVVTDSGWHKQCVIQTKDRFHLIDGNYNNILSYEKSEFLKAFYFNRLTNLSVLINQVDNSFVKYKISEFLHIL